MKNRFLSATALVAAGSVAMVGLALPAGAAAKPHPALPTYTIAYQGPLSGGNAQLGLNMVYAVQLAINNWNHTAGIKFKLAIYKADDKGDPGVAPAIAVAVAANSAIKAVVGPAFSGATESSQLAAYSHAHMPLVSPSATAIALTTPTYNSAHNFFRVVAGDGTQGTADATYVVSKLKQTHIYVLNDASSYGAGLAGVFASVAGKLHAKIKSQTVDGTTGCGAGTGSSTEYPPLAATIRNSGDKFVFYGGYYCDFGLLTSALHAAHYTGQIMSGDGSVDPHYIVDTTPHSAANGAYLSCACTTLGTTAADKAFTKGFTKLAGFVPGTYSAEAFDATNVVIYVIKGLHKVTRQNIINALRAKTFSYKGLTKTVRFQADGDAGGSAVFGYRVLSSKIKEFGAI